VDEVSFARWGSLARTWAPTGEQPVVKTTGIRKGLKIFGAIDFHRGQFQFMESLSYRLTPKSFKQLKADGLPSEVVSPSPNPEKSDWPVPKQPINSTVKRM